MRGNGWNWNSEINKSSAPSHEFFFSTKPSNMQLNLMKPKLLMSELQNYLDMEIENIR
jgi:hypothetical protein